MLRREQGFGWSAVAWFLFLAGGLLLAGRGQPAQAQSCPGYSFYTDTMGTRYWYVSTDPNETVVSVGPNCPSGGGSSTTTSSGGSTGSTGYAYSLSLTVSSSFSANGSTNCSMSAVLYNTSTGSPVPGVVVHWNADTFTTLYGTSTTNSQGIATSSLGTVVTGSDGITASVNIGGGTYSKTAYANATSPGGSPWFTFSAPAGNTTYYCVTGQFYPQDSPINFSFSWGVNATSPLGYLVEIIGRNNGYTATLSSSSGFSSGSSSSDACSWQAGVYNYAGGSVSAGYYAWGTRQYWTEASGSSAGFYVSNNPGA